MKRLIDIWVSPKTQGEKIAAVVIHLFLIYLSAAVIVLVVQISMTAAYILAAIIGIIGISAVVLTQIRLRKQDKAKIDPNS